MRGAVERVVVQEVIERSARTGAESGEHPVRAAPVSVLVTCQRFRPAGEDVETASVASPARPDAYLAAFEHWGAGDVDNWVALPQWRGRSWDDWVNEAALDTETRREEEPRRTPPAFPGTPETAPQGLPVPFLPRQGRAGPVSRIFCGYPLALRGGATIMPR